jgi:transaldolase
MLIFADTANLAEIERLNEHPQVSGFTTNPSLFRAEGVEYAFLHAKEIVRLTDKPVSIDGPLGLICDLGPNVIPKIVCTPYLPPLPERRINLTAICSLRQVDLAADILRPDDICSVFAGRIADNGIHAGGMMRVVRGRIGAQLLWASTREAYNVLDAERVGCDIVTVTPAILAKLDRWERDLDDVAAETIAQFERDGRTVQW